jgi:molybdate transport system ATP-binding protein
MTLTVSLQAQGPIPLDVDFAVAAGEVLALVGPSGSGKTTVLRSIAGLWAPTQARVTAGDQVWADSAKGVNLPPWRRHLGVVFQSYALFPHMTAAGNVMAAMTRKDAEEALRLLHLFGLAGLEDRLPSQLSGGQQQRVAVARALARRPQALVLDEPFSALDAATRQSLYAEITALRATLGMPVILVTHDLNEAQLLADRMVVLDRGKETSAGLVADVMSDPAALRAMGPRQAAALLPAVLAGQDPDGLTRLDTAAGPIFLPGLAGPPGTRLRVRILAHEVILARTRPQGLSAQNILPATITALTPGEGPAIMVHLALGPDRILAQITQRAAAAMQLQPGDAVFVVLKSMSVAQDHVAEGP